MFGWATIEATMIAGEGYKIQKTHINNVTIPLVKYFFNFYSIFSGSTRALTPMTPMMSFGR